MTRISALSRVSHAAVIAVTLVIGSTASMFAADRNGELATSLGDAHVNSVSGRNRVVASVELPRAKSFDIPTHKPWPAPVGHRQPRVSDIPSNAQLSSREVEEERLDRELKAKLVICRGC